MKWVVMLCLSAVLMLPSTLAAQIEPKRRPAATVRQTDDVQQPATRIRVTDSSATARNPRSERRQLLEAIGNTRCPGNSAPWSRCWW